MRSATYTGRGRRSMLVALLTFVFAGLLPVSPLAQRLNLPMAARPAKAAVVSNVLLPSAQNVVVSVARKAALDQLGLSIVAPVAVTVCTNCQGGESVDIGAWPAGTEIVLKMTDFNGGFCSPAPRDYLATDTGHAKIYTSSPENWFIRWNDCNPDDNFTDLATIVSPALPATPPGGTFGSCYRGTDPNWNPVTSALTDFGTVAINPTTCEADPVNTATGNYTKEVVDASYGSWGLAFSFKRSYNSADSISGPLGPGWTHPYSASLSFPVAGEVLLRSSDGQQLVFSQQPDGSYRAAPAGRTKLTAIAGGYQLAFSQGSRWKFDTLGRLTEMLDQSGKGLSLAYTGSNLTTITDAAGRVATLTYTGGVLTKLTLPDARAVNYGYTGGRLSSVQDLAGGTAQYTYDAAGRLANTIDQKNVTVVQNTYGADGRIVTQQDPLGTSTFAWNAATRTATFTDARLKAWKTTYNAYNVVTYRENSLGEGTFYMYDGSLNLASVVDGRGYVTTMNYDSSGNMVSREDALGKTETWTYDGDGNVTQHRNKRGYLTTMTYTNGLLTKITHPDAKFRSYGYDAASRLLSSVTDERGKTTAFGYDAGGNRTSMTSPLGFVTAATYDSVGRALTTVEPRGNIAGANPADYRTSYTYTARDALWTETDPLGNVTTLTYDANGNRDKRIDAKSRTTRWEFNAVNSLAKVIAADLTETSYAYDPVGNLIGRTDAKSHTTTYGYDDANRPKSVTNPLNKTWQLTYDGASNVSQQVDAAGTSTLYCYDKANQLTSVRASIACAQSDPSSLIRYSYDDNGNRTQMIDESGTTGYSYDNRDRLSQTTRGSDNFLFSYDEASNLSKRTYPDGSVFDYLFDNDGRMTTAKLNTVGIAGYQYDAASNLLGTYLPGTLEARTWDRAGRMSGIANWKGSTLISSLAFTLDPVGNPLVGTSQVGAGTYEYDALDRLTKLCTGATCAGATDYTSWAYDTVGNRSSEVKPTGSTTYAYNVGDQMTSSIAGGVTTSYTYDPNGNQASVVGGRSFAWNRFNHLDTTTLSSTTIDYTYDGDGRRTKAAVVGLPAYDTSYLWDASRANADIAMERDVNGGLLRRYGYGLDRIQNWQRSAAGIYTPYYYLYGAVGSVAHLVDAAGNLQWTYSYDPWGKMRTEVKNNSNAPLIDLMRYNAQYLDTATGLYHLRARQYDPARGRFLSTDPLAPLMTDPYVASYVYANNRPTLFSDPSGLAAERSERPHHDSGFQPPRGVDGPPIQFGEATLGAAMLTGCAISGAIGQSIGNQTPYKVIGPTVGWFAGCAIGALEPVFGNPSFGTSGKRLE